jgi:hypothetical protein
MRLKSERVIDTGGSPIYLVPRRDGRPGLLIAQGPSYLLFGRDDLRELQSAIAEELGEPHILRFTKDTND